MTSTQLSHSPNSSSGDANVTYATPAPIDPDLHTFSSAVSQSLHLQHMDSLQANHKMNCD